MKKIKLSKKNYLVIVISFIVLLAIFGTFAWFEWSSSINALIYGEVCAPEIVFVGGTTINGTDMLPVLTKEEGLTKDIQVNLNNTCANDTAVLNLNLNLESFPSRLADSSFKWAVYNVTTEEVNNEPVETLTYVSSGNFANKVQTDTISIAIDLIVTENISTYRLFIWIDATMDNSSAIGGNSFRFKLYGTGRDAIYGQYTMRQVSNTNATSSFWGSPINANQVKSIEFVSTDKVPSVTSGQYDISSAGNAADVVMYYVENGQTEDETPITLYDVYVATGSGITKANVNGEKMFAYLSNCEYIDAENLDTSNIISMKSMFRSDIKLVSILFTSWNTENVENMSGMFFLCGMLRSIDLSSFNTKNVTNLEKMFMNSGIEIIDISTFDTSNVITMEGLFSNCQNLLYANVSNLDNTNLTNTYQMFYNSGTADSIIDFYGFNTSNVTNMSRMFSYYNGKELDLSNFDTSMVTNMFSMFSGTNNLEKLNISSFDTSNVENMQSMFVNCNLSVIDLSNFYTSKVTNMETMFDSCTCSKIDLSNFDFSNVTSMRDFLYQVPITTEIIVKDCTQFNLLTNFIGNGYTNLHTVSGDYVCS